VHRISSLEEFTSSVVIVELCEKILGQTLQGIIWNASGGSDEAWNIQVVIDTLATDILHTDLSHITGENIVAKDRASLKNLIEILSGLMEIVLEATAAGSGDSSLDDSNILSSGAMSVVSSVLQQELGHSYKPEMMRSLKCTRKGRTFSIDSSGTASSSSITEVPRAGNVQVSHEVVATEKFTGSTSSLSSSEQMAPQAILKMPSVSSITSDASENQTPLIKRTSLGARPVSSTPRKVTQRSVIQDERFPRAREELSNKSSGKSRDEEDTAQLVNEALEALSQHTISSSDESTASLIQLRPQQHEIKMPTIDIKIAQPVCIPAAQKDVIIQSKQLNSFESQSVVDQPVATSSQQQERKTQTIAIQTDDVDPVHGQLTKRDVGTQEPMTCTDGTPLQPVVRKSSRSSTGSQPSSVNESCDESEHERFISLPHDTSMLTRDVATASNNSKHEHQEELCQPDVQVVGPESYRNSQSDFPAIQTDDVPVDLSEQSQVNIEPSVSQNAAQPQPHITTHSPVRLRHLEVAAESSEAARQVGDVSEARRQIFLEDALQKDRAAVLKAVYERLLADGEQRQPKIDTPRPRAKGQGKRKQVVFRTLATTIKPTKPSPTASQRKSVHVTSGVRLSGSPYAQPVVGRKIKQPIYRGHSKSKPSYRPLSDQCKVHVKDNELLPLLVDEFPFLHVSAATVQQMWQKQMNQIRGITRSELNRQRHPKAAVHLEEAEHRQQALLELMKKDMQHSQRMVSDTVLLCRGLIFLVASQAK
jgi:hypothetical protein